WQGIELEPKGVGKLVCEEQDFEGNIWLGTENGLVRIRTTPARSYTRRDELADNNAWSVCEGTDGTIWVGTDHGLSAITPRGEVWNWREIEPALEYCDRCLLPNRSGGVMISKMDEAIYEFQDGVFTKRLTYQQLPGLSTGLGEDSFGRLLVFTSHSVLV